MRTLEDLIDSEEPAMPLVMKWLAKSSRPFELLEPSDASGDVLFGLQVTTRSPIGAIAHGTGGILIDHGWLRNLGSGHSKLPRNVGGWNARKSTGHLLVGDDAIGGFFSINGGGLGKDRGFMYYWAPDTLKWEPMAFGYSDFLCWALSDRLDDFYAGLGWPSWEADMRGIGGGQCYTFYPFLWTSQGSVEASVRKAINVAEQHAFNEDAVKQIR